MSRPFHLMVFFTFGVSLEAWAKTGLIDRELTIYKRMVENGHEVTLVTYGDESDLKYQKLTGSMHILPVYTLCKKPSTKLAQLVRSLALPFLLREYIQAGDLLKTNQMFGSWVPLIGKLLYSKPLVVRCGFEFLWNMVRSEKRWVVRNLKFCIGYLLEAASYEFADRIILSSYSDFRYARRFFPFVKQKNISLLRNFVDTDKFYFEQNHESGYESRILCIGRLSRQKNLHCLLEALVSLPYGLDIVGDGEEKPHLKKYALYRGIDIHFLGVSPNDSLPKIINKYPVYVIPSFYENNPKALLEAMACGRVVIGTDVPGIRELVKHGETGFLCKPDASTIRKTIEHAMEISREERYTMGKAARSFVVNNCSISKIYDEEMRIYGEICRN